MRNYNDTILCGALSDSEMNGKQLFIPLEDIEYYFPIPLLYDRISRIHSYQVPDRSRLMLQTTKLEVPRILNLSFKLNAAMKKTLSAWAEN